MRSSLCRRLQHSSIPDFGAGLPQQGMLAGPGGFIGDVHPAQSLRLNLTPPRAIHHAPRLQGPRAAAEHSTTPLRCAARPSPAP